MRRRFAFAILILALAAAASSAQTSNGSGAGQFEISGTVVDALHGQPISHAEMQIIEGIGTEPLQQMTTAADGRFRFIGVPAGKYQLIGECRTCLRQGLDQHEFYFTGIAVGPGLSSTGIVFRMQPEASISGHVVDSFGDPVADADVVIFHHGLWNGSIETDHFADTQTDDSGNYGLGKLIPGSYYVAVSAKPWYAVHSPQQRNSELDVTFPTTFYDGVAERDAASPIVLRAGDEATADFTLTAVPAVTVTLHAPMASVNASETLLGGYDNNLGGSFEERQIDNETIEVSGLPPGEVHLDIRSYSNGESNSRSLALNLAGAASTDLGDASQASPIHYVSGTIQENGQSTSLPNCQVIMRERHTGIAATFQVPPGGIFSFENLPPGLYDVAVSSLEAYLDHITATGAQATGRTVQIDGSDSVQLALEIKHDIAEVPGIALEGDKPRSGMMVLLLSDDHPEDAGLPRRDQSDSDGTFTLRAVAPGRYTVVALENGWDLEWLNPDVVRPYLAGGTHIQVLPKSKAKVKVQVQKAKAN